MAGKPKIDVSAWNGRVTSAAEYWRQKIQDTDPIIDMYRARESGTTDMPIANMVWEYGQSMVPQIFYQDPQPLVDPLRPGEQRKAEVLERVLSHAVGEAKFSKYGRPVVLDGLFRGWGVSKTGYLPPATAFMVTPQGELKEKATPSVSTPGETRRGEEDMNGRAVFNHIDIYDFVMDPDCGGDIDKARWVAHRTRESVDELQRDPNNRNTKDIENAITTEESVAAHLGDTTNIPTDMKYAVVWEIWIKQVGPHRHRLLKIVDGHDKFLRWEDWPYEEWPFQVLVFNPDPKGEIPGLSDVLPALGLQKTLNGYIARENNYVKNLTAKYLFDERLDKELVNAIRRGVDNTMIPCSRDHYDERQGLKDKIYPIPYAQLPDAFWPAKDGLKTLMREVMGHTPFGGGDAKSAGSATESNLLAQTASLRVDDRLTNGTAVWARQVFQHMLGIIRDFYDEGAVPVLTPAGEREFQEFTEEDINIDASVRINFGTMGRITSKPERAKNLLIIAQQLGEYFMAPHGVPQPMREVLRRVLESYDIKDAEALLPPQIAPVDPMRENASILLGDGAQVSPHDDHQYHMDAHMAAMERAERQGYVDAVQEFQEHLMDHQAASMEAMQAGRPVASSGSPMGFNAQGEMGNPGGGPGATPTSPDQLMGVNVEGGM